MGVGQEVKFLLEGVQDESYLQQRIAEYHLGRSGCVRPLGDKSGVGAKMSYTEKGALQG